MSKRDSKLLIQDMLEAVEKISRYIEDMGFDELKNDNKTTDAVIRNLEIIGEAANHLPVDAKNKSSDVKWERIIGLRNRIIHEYFGIDIKIVWKILNHDLPEFEESLKLLESKYL